MKAVISWWDLGDSEQTIDSLDEYLRAGGLGPWERVPELVVKFWISDRENNRWGAVQIWQHDGPGPDTPPNLVTGLVGYPPSTRLVFDVDASVEGAHTLGRITGHGRAVEGLPAGSS